MTIHKILSLLSFLLIISGCASFNKESTPNSLESNLSADLVEKTDMEDALPNTGENCVPKTGSIFGLSRTCKSSRSLFYNPLSKDKIDSPTDAAIRKHDQKSPKNCKIKEGTLFGLSRTCESSDAFSKSLSD